MAKRGARQQSTGLQRVQVCLVALLGVWLVGAIGSSLTTPQIPGWYTSLVTPPFTPPSTAFAPVWTLLYLLMAIAAVQVWRQGWKKPAVERALFVFAVQLFLNFLWSILFFGMHNPLLAFLDILLLWSTILLTIILFWHIARAAALLLVPYLAWVSFAAYINAGIVWLN